MLTQLNTVAMRNVRHSKGWPTTHKDIEVFHSPGTFLVRLSDKFEKYIPIWKALQADWDFYITQISHNIHDVDDINTGQQRYYIKGDRKEFECIDLSLITWMNTAQPGLSIQSIIYAYEKYKTI